MLSSSGESKYWEIETTGRYLANERRDLTVSYVRSHSTRDLNDYDDFFGNFREPDHQSQRELAELDRRAASLDRPRLARSAGHVDLLADLRVAHRLPVVGRR